MKTNPIRAEIFNLEGEIVSICKDMNNMNLSKLIDSVYFIKYLDSNRNILWTERFVKALELEYAHVAH